MGNDTEEITARLRAAGCVFADDEARVLLDTTSDPVELAAMVERRAAGEPLERVVGWAAFCGLRIAIDPDVFVPRRRSELVVEAAIELASPAAVVVDLCCGTGAIGAAIATQVVGIELHAADIEPTATACARRNLIGIGTVHEGDLYDALPPSLVGRIDVIVANAPYVPTDAIGLLPAEARLHEPLVTLDGGSDGLEVHRRIAAGAPAWLAPGGHLLIETTDEQSHVAQRFFSDHGLDARRMTSETLDTTVVVGTRPVGA
jgi:release factor glutamine methyltransferase